MLYKILGFPWLRILCQVLCLNFLHQKMNYLAVVWNPMAWLTTFATQLIYHAQVAICSTNRWPTPKPT